MPFTNMPIRIIGICSAIAMMDAKNPVFQQKKTIKTIHKLESEANIPANV